MLRRPGRDCTLRGIGFTIRDMVAWRVYGVQDPGRQHASSQGCQREGRTRCSYAPPAYSMQRFTLPSRLAFDWRSPEAFATPRATPVSGGRVVIEHPGQRHFECAGQLDVGVDADAGGAVLDAGDLAVADAGEVLQSLLPKIAPLAQTSDDSAHPDALSKDIRVDWITGHMKTLVVLSLKIHDGSVLFCDQSGLRCALEPTFENCLNHAQIDRTTPVRSQTAASLRRGPAR